MKKLIYGGILWLLTAAVFGAVISQYYMVKEIEKIREAFYISSVAETNINLALAKSMRNEEYADLLKHHESMLEISVLSFTRDGNNIGLLSDNDLCVLNKVREYWENECNRNCLPRLLPVFLRMDVVAYNEAAKRDDFAAACL